MNSIEMVEQIDLFSNHKLKRKKDLQTLIETASANKKFNELEKLSFTAKYISGLQRVLKKGIINPGSKNIPEEKAGLDYVKKDYSDNLQKLIEQLKDLISSTPGETKSYFNKTYLELSHQSLQNLMELIEDLEWTKIYFNEQKRQADE